MKSSYFPSQLKNEFCFAGPEAAVRSAGKALFAGTNPRGPRYVTKVTNVVRPGCPIVISSHYYSRKKSTLAVHLCAADNVPPLINEHVSCRSQNGINRAENTVGTGYGTDSTDGRTNRPREEISMNRFGSIVASFARDKEMWKMELEF